MATEVRVMEKPIQLQHHNQQQQQQPPPPQESLKCPRCDSSNTKFCYYNNYSLSQPRHFCKACKRYWTRGGTLRNVPVGGGCRKNKRVKRPITTTSTSVNVQVNQSQVNHHTNPNPNHNPNLDHSQITPSTTLNSNSNHHLNPLFYGLIPENPNYPKFDTSVSNVNENLVPGYNILQTHMKGNGIGFSNTSTGGLAGSNHCHNSNLTFSSYMKSSINYGGGSTSSSTSTPIMASLLASSINQQQRFMGFANNYDGGSMANDLKVEEAQNRMEWNNNNFQGRNKNDQIEADTNSILWDIDNKGGGWLDPTSNMGSSVPL